MAAFSTADGAGHIGEADLEEGERVCEGIGTSMSGGGRQGKWEARGPRRRGGGGLILSSGVAGEVVGWRPRPRSLEQEGDRGSVGGWAGSGGLGGPAQVGSVQGGGLLSLSLLFPFTFFLFFFSVLFLVSLLFCFSKIPKWHLICCYQICHNHKKFHPKII